MLTQYDVDNERETKRQAALKDAVSGLANMAKEAKTKREQALSVSNDMRKQGYDVNPDMVEKSLAPEQSGLSKWFAKTPIGQSMGMEVQERPDLYAKRTDEWSKANSNAEEDRKFKKEEGRADLAKTYAEIQKLRAEAQKAGGGVVPALTKGQEAADKDYGKQYQNFASKGVVNSAATLNKLEAIAAELENDAKDGGLEASGGSIVGSKFFPDFLRRSDSIRRRDDARNAANSTLKELFPGALSDAEREAAAQEYYNDKLGAKENAAIIKGKIAQLRQVRENEVAKAKYFEGKGTLKGYEMSDAPVEAYKRTASAEGSWGNEAAAKDPAQIKQQLKGMSREEKIKRLQGGSSR